MGDKPNYTDVNLAIIERCKKGDKKAFEELYILYSDAMFNISARILNNEEEAKEVLQDCFLKIFQSIDKYDSKFSFGAWFKRIVINHSLNTLKKRRPNILPLKEEIYVADDEDDNEEEDVIYEVEMIRRCVQSLPDGYRMVITLYLFEKYSHKEIAEFLGISEGTSRSQYNRAKKKLVELLKQNKIPNGR